MNQVIRRCALLRALATAAILLISTNVFAQTRFDVNRFVVEGNTLLTENEIRSIVSPFEGKNRDFGDVQRALEALQDAFVSRGYAAVRVTVPEQDLVAGQVRIQVVEARLASVRVEANQYFDADNVRAGMPSLKVGESPNTISVSENVQLVNENPAKQVSVSLAAASEPGKVDAVVRVTDEKPERWSVSFDNTGTSATGFYRAGLGYQNANVGNRDHVLSLQYITSPDHVRDVRIFGVGYHVPLYERKGAFDVFGGYSDVNSGTVSNLFAISGSGTIFGMRYTQLLPRLGLYDQRLAAGLDYRDFHNNVELLGTTGSLLPDITIKPWSLTYNGRMSRVGQDAGFYVTYSNNLPGGADGDQNAFTATRPGADAGYSIWRYGAVFSQSLPQDFLVRTQVTAQWTRDLLIPGEQFGMGGADSVRGFFEREVASDVGHRVALEAYSPDFGASFGENWRSRALVFVDAARGYDRQPARIATNEVNGLSSAGIGLRVTQGRRLSARVDFAHVLNAAGTRPVGKERLHFALVYSF